MPDALRRVRPALWWVIAAASIWLRSGFPIRAIGEAVFDDSLFLRLAGSLGSGHWLGSYDQVTLAKGMFYPAFILISFVAGIPLNLAEQAVYVGACALVARLMPSGRSWPGLLVFALLAFNPVLLHWEMTRVIREALYVSQALAVVALLAGIALPREGMPSAWRGFALGLVFGSFWLTREEGPWLIPALVTIVLVAVPAWWRTPAIALRAGGSILLAGIVAASMIGGVAAMNQARYGRFITTEFKDPAFQHGYGALARIQPENWRRYVIFPKDARDRAYAASPAAAELRSLFDGPRGEAWRRIGCEQTATADCPEILSGWFMWALRDAVVLAGHGASAAEAMAFYDRLGGEIDEACDSRRLACNAQRATLQPPFRWHYLLDSARVSLRLSWLLLQLGGGPSKPYPAPARAWPC